MGWLDSGHRKEKVSVRTGDGCCGREEQELHRFCPAFFPAFGQRRLADKPIHDAMPCGISQKLHFMRKHTFLAQAISRGTMTKSTGSRLLIGWMTNGLNVSVK